MTTVVKDRPGTARRVRAKRGTVVAVIAFLVVLVLAEVGARLLGPHLPTTDGWNDQTLAAHVANMRTLGERDGADVLLVGSSVVGEGLDPELLGTASSEHDSAYNLWGAAYLMRSLAVLTEEVALQTLNPEVVVVGLTSRELNDAGAGKDAQHERLTSSPAMRRLTGQQTLPQRVGEAIGQWSAFVRLRDTIRQPTAVLGAFVGAARGDQRRTGVEPLGMASTPENQTFELRQEHLDQERAALAGFMVGGQELAALESLVEASRARGVTVLVVNMPVYEDAYVPLHPRGATDQARYKAVLEQWADDHDVAYLDATRSQWDQEWFSNENHLNERGAERLTRMVAELIDALAAE